jgi:hypothetical protein
VHLVGFTIPTYYDARSTKLKVCESHKDVIKAYLNTQVSPADITKCVTVQCHEIHNAQKTVITVTSVKLYQLQQVNQQNLNTQNHHTQDFFPHFLMYNLCSFK